MYCCVAENPCRPVLLCISLTVAWCGFRNAGERKRECWRRLVVPIVAKPKPCKLREPGSAVLAVRACICFGSCIVFDATRAIGGRTSMRVLLQKS